MLERKNKGPVGSFSKFEVKLSTGLSKGSSVNNFLF